MKLKEWQKITLLVVGIFLVVGLFYYLLLSGVSEKAPPLARESLLEINISGAIPERAAPDPLTRLIEGEPLSIQKLLGNIRKAMVDEKVVGLLLRLSFSDMGWAKATELRRALEQFKSNGKPVYVYMEMAGNKEYYLASVADTIMMLPTGVLMVNGLQGQALFLKNTLAKLGIEADFVAHGKYKNAPDMFTREKMSDAQREVLNAILDDYFDEYVATVAAARQLSTAQVKNIIDEGFLSARRAREVGLVDTLVYYRDFAEKFKKSGSKRKRIVNLARYDKIPASKLGIKAKQKIAVIYGIGSIVLGGEDAFGQDGLITSEGMAAAIQKAADDKSIKAIILRIDSPGGSGSASEVIWREVVKAREKKAVIVSVSDLAASGGYYISMAADSIVAHPQSLVGSIGVFAGKFSLGGLYKKIGMNVEELKRGRNADIFGELKKFTPEQREIIRKYIMEFYEDFVQKVADGRHMSFEEVDRIAQGRVWTGRQGKEIGLVDRLGDFKTAVDMAKKMAGIPLEEPVQLVTYPRIRTLIERLLGESLEMRSWKNVITQWQMFPFLPTIVSAIPYFHDGEPLFLMPVWFSIQ